jgi:hypothetical protein
VAELLVGGQLLEQYGTALHYRIEMESMAIEKPILQIKKKGKRNENQNVHCTLYFTNEQCEESL